MGLPNSPMAGADIRVASGNFTVAKPLGVLDGVDYMHTGEVRKIAVICRATIGQVGNIEHENVSIGKAGRKRHMGVRPTVRGVAMNPVDHPHGGGEGKAPTGMPPKTPWGKPAMGLRTRRNKLTQRLIVRSRHAR